MKKAFQIYKYDMSSMMYPSHLTLKHVKLFTNIYKRLATTEEIEACKLYTFCRGRVLIGQQKCYYSNDNYSWIEVFNIPLNVDRYFQNNKTFKEIIPKQSLGITDIQNDS